jgi:hypothetical protein
MLIFNSCLLQAGRAELKSPVLCNGVKEGKIWDRKYIQPAFDWDLSKPGTPDGMQRRIILNFSSKIFGSVII